MAKYHTITAIVKYMWTTHTQTHTPDINNLITTDSNHCSKYGKYKEIVLPEPATRYNNENLCIVLYV